MFIFRFFGYSLLAAESFECRLAMRVVNALWLLVDLAVLALLIASPSSKAFNRNYSQMAEIITIANYLFAAITHLAILVHIQVVTDKEKIWNKKLANLERLLDTKCGVKINQEAIKRENLWKVSIAFTFSTLCSVINVIYGLDEDKSSLLVWHNCCLKTFINLRYIQNFCRIDFIRHHILAFHEAVRHTIEKNGIEWKLILVLDTMNRRHSRTVVTKIDDANEILLFKRFYATLFEAIKLIENCFGWSLLAMISFTFIDLTSNLYWFFIALLNLDETSHLVDCAVEIVPSVVIISCLIHSSFDANRRAKEVINSIGKLFTSTASSYNDMIKEMMLQIYHEKIENSANDFFIVDFQLFVGVSCCY